MCHFISLVVGGASLDEFTTFMRKHGRRAVPVVNESLAVACNADEAQYLTTNSHCDCGTVLARGDPHASDPADIDASKLMRRGWSRSKIDRWLEHKRKAAERRPSPHPVDSFAFWSTLLRDLQTDLSPTSLGIFLHDYSGDIETEQFVAKRRLVQLGASLENSLRTMQENELLMFSARPGFPK